ncbi:MAG: glycosyltransferase family 2 protein [Planctomyces sp.]|nr:glycosyltransferase family 2 protein [Planctomyces sp.]
MTDFLPPNGAVSSDSESGRPLPADTLVSVVLPVFNEVGVLEQLHASVEHALRGCGVRYEILYVDDGSTDGSGPALDAIADRCRAARVLHFSRNFGHQAAVQAGLEHARGDAVIIMDSDMQDDPGAFRAFLDLWRAGFDVVYAVRMGRKESLPKRVLFVSFYRVLNAISRTEIPRDAGNFGLVDRRVAREIAGVLDRDRYFPGLRSWVGFRQIGVAVERGRRHDDKPRVSLRGLFRLAKTAVFSFSAAPLTMFYFIAAASLLTSLGLSGFALYHKLVTGTALPGWTSTTIVVSLFGALNALGIGILGEYAIRIYDQVRARPGYIVARTCGTSTPHAVEAQCPEAAVHGEARQLLDWVSDQWAARSLTHRK